MCASELESRRERGAGGRVSSYQTHCGQGVSAECACASQAVTLRGWRASGISVSECVSVRHGAPPPHTRARRDRRRELRRSVPAPYTPLGRLAREPTQQMYERSADDGAEWSICPQRNKNHGCRAQAARFICPRSNKNHGCLL